MVAAAVIGSAVIGAGASMASANAQSRGARRAADAQTQAADQANATQLAIYQDQRRLLTPSALAGAQANARRMLMMGIPPAEVRAYLSNLTSAFNSPGPGQTAPMVGYNSGGYLEPTGGGMAGGIGFGGDRERTLGDLSGSSGGQTPPYLPGGAGGGEQEDPFAWVDSWQWQPNSPDYQFRFDEGLRALDRSASARGRLFSGATIRGAERYGQGLAAGAFNDDFSRFGQLAGEGAESTDTVVNVGGQYADAYGANTIGAGNARASGYLRSGDAQAAGYQGVANSVNGAIGAYGGYRGWWG